METMIRRSAIPAGNLRILLADSHSVPSHGTSRSVRSTVQVDSALSRALTAAALEIYLGRKPSSEELSGEMRIPGEKPWFPAHPDFYYNISHSGGIAVCGLSDHPIGIDIQKVTKNTKQILRIAKRFFSAEEQESLQELQDTNEPAAMCRLFCRYWTARESYIKLIGRGLAEPFENFRPDLDAGVIHALRSHCTDSTGPLSEDTFYLTECPAPEGFCLTVCSTVPLPACTPEEIFDHS